MRSKLLCAVFAAVTTLVACSGKAPTGGDTSTAAKTVNTPQVQGGAPQSASTTASQAAALEEAKWRANWRQKYLAGRDREKDRAVVARATQDALSAPDADPSDIAAKAKSLGSDPQKTFEFLRDKVGIEPYAGVLRGARGTLMANSGNSLDRALLAQELLKAQGITSRLVSGQLPEEKARALLDRFLAGGPVPRSLAPQQSAAGEADITQEAADIAAKSGLPQEGVAELLGHARDREQIFRSQIAANAAKQFASLSRQLAQDGKRVPVDVAALHASFVERLRKHYWVQVRGAGGKWSDFDPTFPDAASGTRYGLNSTVLTDIPGSEYHELHISLVYLAIRDGAHTEDVLASGNVRASEALFEPVNFSIQPTGGPDSLAALSTLDIRKKIQSLQDMHRFQGIVNIGSEVIAGRAFDLDGNVFDRPDAPLPTAPQATALADALGGDSQNPPKFVELRMVLQLTGPGREPEQQIRTLIRDKEAHAPGSAPPLMSWELLLQPQWVSPEWVGFNGLRQVAAALKATSDPKAKDRTTDIRSPQVASMRLLQLALLRQSSLTDALRQRRQVTAMIDEPQLTIYGYRLKELRKDSAEIRSENFIDLVENAVRVVPSNGNAVASAYEAALANSAADSALEVGVLGLFHPGSDTSSGADVFELARSNGRPPFLASSRDVDLLRSSGVSESDIEWIYDNESPAARLLVAVSPGGTTAWWSVRQDGIAVLRMNGGRGQGITETDIVNMKVVVASLCFLESLVAYGCVGASEALPSTIVCVLSTYVSLGGVLFHHEVRIGFALALLAVELIHMGYDAQQIVYSEENHCSGGGEH
jgi:transglutaminase-like putative cysteine protease